MEHQQDIRKLFRKYLNSELSEQELETLLKYFRISGRERDELRWLIERELDTPLPAEYEEEATIIAGSVEKELFKTSHKKIKPLWRYATVAALLCAVLATAYLLLRQNDRHPVQQQMANDVAPGGNRAVLTLANGRKILLDSAGTGGIFEQAGIRVTKIADGQIAYEIENTDVHLSNTYHTISTPRGGQYRITLPDGSTVWLNAASSLRYPTAFVGDERRVTLTGEGYFEVMPDEQHPFIVESNGQSVQVLGTAFNINAYADESVVATTLVHGSIMLHGSLSGTEKLLKPGEQAILHERAFHVRRVDVGDFTSWKNGLIVLNDADLSTIIRQLERWYDVEFDLPEVSTSAKVFGELRRDVRLSEILDALHQYYGLTFEIQERRVIVRK